jgi:putative flippase GtrA
LTKATALARAVSLRERVLDASSLGDVLRLLQTHPFLRFLAVGALNTVVGYCLFLIALAIMPTTFSAMVISTVLSVLFNFKTTGRMVFGVRDTRLLARFVGVYGVVFLYNWLGLDILQAASFRPWLAGLILLPGGVVIAYTLNSRFVFRRGA